MLTWQDVQQGIFAGESGGDYNALFGFQNKPDGLFSDIKVTDMTLDQVLKFADPRGEYASYVSYNNDGEISTPMGAYQIVGSTLRDAKEALGLSGDTKFTKETQDKIAKWILKTQGTDAWVGYKGPKVKGQNEMQQPRNQPMNVFSMFKNQISNRQRPQAGGIMGFLQNPETIRTFGTMSGTDFGARLAGLADKRIAKDEALQKRNTTIRYLVGQEGGRPYAEAILAGADARKTLEDFFTATGKTGADNIQSSVQLPNYAGFLVTTKSGQVYVTTRDNRRLTDQKEIDDYILAAQKGEIEFVGDKSQSRSAGTQAGRYEFVTKIESAKGFAAKKVAWVDGVYKQAANIDNTVRLYKQALDQLDKGASSGRIAEIIPTTSAVTALLETIGGELGLDVIGSVTFGALSKSEMDLAMDLGMPRTDLSPPELREWLLERIDAKEKASVALKDTAAYLSQEDVTVNDYYTKYLRIDPTKNIETPNDTQNNTTKKPVNPENPLDLDFGDESVE